MIFSSPNTLMRCIDQRGKALRSRFLVDEALGKSVGLIDR